MKKILASFVIAVQQDKILLVEHKEESRHPTGVYTIPGGEMDAEELALLQDSRSLKKIARKTAIRELDEESDLKVNEEDLQFVGLYDITIERKIGRTHPTIFLYFCKTSQKRLREGRETKPLWGNINDFLVDKYPHPEVSPYFLDSIKDVLRSYLKSL